jgi:hypothetical protein
LSVTARCCSLGLPHHLFPSWSNSTACCLYSPSMLHQSAATRVIFRKHKSEPVPLLLQKKFKWLHISFGIKPKLFSVAFETLIIRTCPSLWTLMVLKAYKTSFYSWNMPNSLRSHSFCIWFLFLEHFFLDCLNNVSFSPFRSQLKCHQLRKIFPYHLFMTALTTAQPHSIPTSCLIVLQHSSLWWKSPVHLFM